MKISDTTRDLSVFDAETIINIFLWGQDTVPAALFDRVKTAEYVESLPQVFIEGVGQVPVVRLRIDADDLMTSGSGRFAKISQFEIVADFFASSTLTEGVYNFASLESALFPEFQKDYKNSFGLEHYTRSDDIDLNAERTYIFNNSSFTLRDDAGGADFEFVVNSDGSREIRNVKIAPFNDNFDFVGGSRRSEIFNFFTGDKIDPYGIGTRVEFTYDQSVIAARTYTEADHQADVDYVDSALSGITLPMLFTLEGVLSTRSKFLSAADYEIDDFKTFVGSFEDETVEPFDVFGNDLLFVSRILVLAGEGKDVVLGGLFRDRLYGHAGDDVLDG
ncbi:MAG: hypothetical protein AAGK37_16505 [Pseudomonadota bacterium]